MMHLTRHNRLSNEETAKLMLLINETLFIRTAYQ
jgi:hypothetical protein